MKKVLLSLFALLASFEVSNAQVSGMNIGYCHGKLGPFPSTSDTYFSDLSTKKKTWTSGAILIKKEKINSLAGNQIREIHAGLISKLNVDSLAVWVSESLDGPILSTDTIATPAKGWNTVALTKPVDITSDMQTLYVGYSYHQKSTSKAMSCTKTPEPGYSCFIRSGNDEWKDYSSDYTVSVEALVYGDKLPKYDLTLSALDVQQNYVVDNGNLEFTMKVFNNATVTINGFDAVCTVDGSDEKYTVHCDSSIAYNESKTITMTVSPTAIQTMDPATRTLTVTLTNLTEGEDEIPSDNTLSGTFNVTLHSFVRNVLLEEFTTEKCTNCPRVASYVHDAMNEPEFQGRLNTMENHAGYYTDSFTATFHNDWTWFFDNLYAPAVLYDRHAEDGAVTAVTCPNSKLELFEGIRKRLRETAFVSLKVTADVDGENQKINVKVTGTRAKENFTKNPARITVVLTETNLAAISQAGAGGDYTHYNVGRRVNSIWGDVLEWNGDDYTYECSIPYTQNYVLDNLGVLAFIHDYDPDDKTKCDVANSAAITSAEFTGKATAIFAPNASTNDSKALYFDLQGRKLSAPTKGFNIVKRNGKFIKQILH
mgnify:FL=1